jgi:hypothetical protein
MMTVLKKALFPTILAIIAALGFSSAIGITSLRHASAASAPTPGIGLYALGNNLSYISNPGQYGLVVGTTSEASALAGLPGRSLVYFTGTDVNANWSTGVPYSQAAANGWLLTDSSGSPLVNLGYADDYVGDVGNAAYQQAWITNVLAFLTAHPGIDGVFIDDVLADLRPLTGTEAAKYPTQQAWASAQLSFVRAAGNALRSNGYYVLANSSGYIPGDPASNSGAANINWWRQVGPYVSGLMNEYYMEVSNGANTLRTTGGDWTQNWDSWQQLITTAQSMGVDFVGVTYGSPGDIHAMTYARASFLQEWNGGGSTFMFNSGTTNDPSDPAWTTDIGQPVSGKQQVGVGWMRAYAGGIALVNPSPSTSQTFQLGGSYRTSSGSTVTSSRSGPPRARS